MAGWRLGVRGACLRPPCAPSPFSSAGSATCSWCGWGLAIEEARRVPSFPYPTVKRCCMISLCVRVGLNFLPTIVGAHSDCSLGGAKSAVWVVLQSDHSDCNLPFSFLTNRSPPLIIFAPPPHPIHRPKNPLARAPRSAEIAPAPPSLLSSF